MGISVVVSQTSLIGLASASPTNDVQSPAATAYGSASPSSTTTYEPNSQHVNVRNAVDSFVGMPLCSFVTTAPPSHDGADDDDDVALGKVSSCTCADEPTGTNMSPP